MDPLHSICSNLRPPKTIEQLSLSHRIRERFDPNGPDPTGPAPPPAVPSAPSCAGRRTGESTYSKHRRPRESKTRRHEMAQPSALAAAATAGQTDAEREEALDRMLTRLALADDARLAPLLARVLPYAITSLASSAAPVRKLVRTSFRSHLSPDSVPISV
jgi:hypothetical protein